MGDLVFPLLTIILVYCKKLYYKQLILQALLLLHLLLQLWMEICTTCTGFLIILIEPLLRKVMFHSYIHITNREYKSSISIGVVRSGEKGSREVLITQHPPLHLFNMLKCPSRNVVFGYNSLIQLFNLGKVFCWCLESKFKSFQYTRNNESLAVHGITSKMHIQKLDGEDRPAFFP